MQWCGYRKQVTGCIKSICSNLKAAFRVLQIDFVKTNTGRRAVLRGHFAQGAWTYPPSGCQLVFRAIKQRDWYVNKTPRFYPTVTWRMIRGFYRKTNSVHPRFLPGNRAPEITDFTGNLQIRSLAWSTERDLSPVKDTCPLWKLLS